VREVTAIFAANDQMALGILRALYEAGRAVPRDLSIVGFDDIPEAQFFTPPLTTVRQDFNEVGRQSLMLLLGEMASSTRSSSRVTVPPRLEIRESTAQPRSAV
jgi:DNA-binding LacI/PurR family transcriptional regulator